MNVISIILLVLILSAVAFAIFRICKNKSIGRCPGCSGDCEQCMKKI